MRLGGGDDDFKEFRIKPETATAVLESGSYKKISEPEFSDESRRLPVRK